MIRPIPRKKSWKSPKDGRNPSSIISFRKRLIPRAFIVETTLPPEERQNTDDPNLQRLDRFVELTLITAGRLSCMKQKQFALLSFCSCCSWPCRRLPAGSAVLMMSGPPRNAAVVDVLANSSLEPWLETAVSEFNAAGTETAGGRQIYAQLDTAESGQAVLDLAGGASRSLLVDSRK